MEQISDRLMQVLSNLMSNAAKFSQDGEQVELSAIPDDGTVRVAVKDNGEGIPKEFHKDIFEKFTQVDATDTRQKGGTGLSLHISRAIIEQHGGTLGFETEVDVGTTFFFMLPVIK
jgi:signal transduction histidine kinase